MEHAMEITVNTEDALLVHDILRLFLPTYDSDKADVESEYQIAFHRSGEDYYLVYNELFDEDSVSEEPSRPRIPNMEFVLSKPQRDPHPPHPSPIPNRHTSLHITLDSYDWPAFDTLAASFSRLGKVIFGLRDKSEVKLFVGEDTDGDAADDSDSVSEPEFEPEPEPELEPAPEDVQDRVHRIERLTQAGKVRYACRDTEDEGWITVETQEDADQSEALVVLEYLRDIP
ncbi:hypothetical protein NM688_g8449 [Phlebia brevispora]|uniref:Uncharacterized protein n=1 Tax=Phlebia brevispora TaxID=194682 RepID=A0ACC1RRB6_9APHY|nr:hypothetical protein NM688_g8449 [Phlebia brevispora]